MSMQLALAGKEAIETKTREHRRQVSQRGYGTHYGDHSSYRPPAGSNLTESSCVVWAMECAAYAFNKVSANSKWNRISHVTRQNKLRGTVLIGELIKLGWTGIYWNPDTTDTSDSEHSYSAHVAKTKKTYYKLPVSDLVVDYRRSPVNMTGIDTLDKVPFWIGCARGGMHVFCGTGANVSEFHWDSPATDPNAMELVALKDYEWLSGIVAVPPTVWNSASR